MQALSQLLAGLARRHKRTLCILFLVMLWLGPGATALYAHYEDRPGILVLSNRQKEHRYATLIKSEIEKVLAENERLHADVYSDTVYGWKSGDREHDRALTNVMRQRYSASNIHLLVPLGNSAVEFVRIHGHELFPEASVVYLAESFGSTATTPPLLQATGVIFHFEAEATLALALQQNPGTRHVVVVAGTGDDEKNEILSVRNEFRRFEETIDFQYVTDISLGNLLDRLSKIPPNSVVLLLNFTQDSEGELFIPTQVAPTMSQAATAPMYVVYSSGVGAGAVGGQVHDIAAIGKMLGELVVRVVKGTRASEIPVQEGTFQRPMFDWQQMRRWKISESQLPPGSVIINRDITAWTRYKWWILGATALVLVQAALIAGLALEWLRKRKAESRLAIRLHREQLIADLASTFISVPAMLVGENIQHAFERVLQTYGLDRIALFEYSKDHATVHLRHLQQRADAPATPEELQRAQINWITSRMLSAKPDYGTTLSALPEEAASTREFLESLGVHSYASFPLQSESEIHGLLSFSSLTRETEWTPDILHELQTVADIFSNVLTRKHAEEESRRSEELKTKIIDCVSSLLVVIDGDGKIIEVNKRWKEFWADNGGAAQSLIGSNYLDVCRQGAAAGLQDAEQALAGILQILKGESEHFEMEYECSSPHGQRWHVMIVDALIDHVNGAVIRHRDITFARQAYALLRESEDRFRVIADSAPVMIWMSGPDKMFTHFNRPWLEFAGRPLERELGYGWAERVHREDFERVLRIYTEAFDAKQFFQLQYRLLRADGKYRWILDSGVPRTLANGEFAGYIGGCIDVTELKESEEARNRLSGLLITAQEQERASIARELHDHINQRLALLAIQIQEFQHSIKGLLPEKVPQVQQLWTLTNQISHDVQALSHELHSSQLQHLGLTSAIRSLCKEFGTVAGLETEFSSRGTPVKIEEQVALAVFRIAQESLRNVAKYSNAQNVKTALIWNSGELLFSVADDGVGFDPEAISGVGLGLISMKERMRLVGGELSIRTSPGAGTRIEARVPLIESQAVDQKASDSVRVERRKRVRA